MFINCIIRNDNMQSNRYFHDHRPVCSLWLPSSLVACTDQHYHVVKWTRLCGEGPIFSHSLSCQNCCGSVMAAILSDSQCHYFVVLGTDETLLSYCYWGRYQRLYYPDAA